MAIPGPSPADPATRWLAELHTHPTHHDLLAAFDLLRTIDQLSQGECDLSESTGETPPREPVRFTHSTDLALPLGELLAVTRDPDDPTLHLLTTAGTGPCGHASPLPLALADELADDPLTLAVLDLFHHRRTLLLCRGLLAADLAGSLDTHTAADPWSRRIIALVGLTHAALTPLEALPHTALTPLEALRLAPLLASADRSPRALALALRRLLPALCPDDGRAPTLHCELIGDAWTPLAAEHHTRLGG
ncbi:MAG: type VI secretion system baseplate subunit TssG, partial [Nannocystis sp.]